MPKTKSSPSSSPSSSSPAADAAAVHAGGCGGGGGGGPAPAEGQQQPPKSLRGAPTHFSSCSSSPEATAVKRRRLTKTGGLAIALCVTAASYLSVLVANSRRALSTAHHQLGGAGSPVPPWEPRRSDAAIAGIAVRAEARLRASESRGSRTAGEADGGGVGGGGSMAEPLAAGGMRWPEVLPNAGRSVDGDKGVDMDAGTRSPHSGTVQRHRQAWLTRRARDLLREEITAAWGTANTARLPGTAEGGGADGGMAAAPAAVATAAAGNAAAGHRGRRIDRESTTTTPEGTDRAGSPASGGAGDHQNRRPGGAALSSSRERVRSGPSAEERAGRMELGARLWNATYVPPIEPQRRLELIDMWTGNAARREDGGDGARIDVDGESENDAAASAGRILYVISSFDRGERLGPAFRGHDKLDFILMMMDEMREACEVGFSPHVHLIAAWDLSEAEALVRDRLFCRRAGASVPFSLEEHPPSIGNDLSLKHRVYMKTRLEDFDIFLQVEDDVILTLNHILIFQEESEILEKRRRPDGSLVPNTAVPGFIRIEHHQGDSGTFSGPGSSGEEWVEWEICLSRFRAMKILEAGTYLTLGPSQPLPHGGNNQGMWLATREQLRRLSEKPSCGYLNFDESSVKGHVETHSGSIQMFRPNCGLQKVFPARSFESFLVHHRTNNKLGVRGESVPGVPITLLRDWVEQFIRDESFLKSEWNAPHNF